MSHFVIMDNALRHSLVQHLLVPLLQAFWLGDLLVHWVTMEDVIIPFTGWTGPDMTRCKPDRERCSCNHYKRSKLIYSHSICVRIFMQLQTACSRAWNTKPNEHTLRCIMGSY